MTPGNKCARQGQCPEAAFVEGEEIPRVGNDRGERGVRGRWGGEQTGLPILLLWPLDSCFSSQ